MTFAIQPHVLDRFAAWPLAWLLPALAVMCLVATRVLTAREKELPAFLASAGFLAFMLLSVVVGLYPLVLPASGDLAASLTVQNASGPAYSMRVALFWWIPGMVLVTGYTTCVPSALVGPSPLPPNH
jgi:cytochrome d ubiquinol oxidase subunit II